MMLQLLSICSEYLGFGELGLSQPGVEVDTVSQVTERIKLPSGGVQATYLASVLSCIETLTAESLSHQTSGRDCESAIATTVCAGVDARYQPAGPDTVKAYNAFKERTSQGRLVPSMSDLDDQHSEDEVQASHFAEAMYNACMNRRFFVTTTGRFGLGPHFMKAGDIVAILYGLQWPAVLRVAGNDFIFLGTAYIHGMMYGEAIRSTADSEPTDSVFRIR